MAAIELKGATLEYIECGAGRPVVFVHGSASDYRTWRRPVEAFGERFRAIAYSRRYHWPNRPIAPRGTYALSEHADDLAALLRRLNAAPADLIGHSYGGVVCLKLASEQPDVARSLTLIEPPVLGLFVSFPPKPAEILRLALRHPRTAAGIVKLGAFGMKPAMSAFERGDREKALEKLGIAVLGREAFEGLSDERTAQVRDNLIPEELASPEALPRIDPPELDRVRAPVLLVGGSRSPRVFARLLDALESALPETERVEISGASHLVHEDDPAAFERALSDFLDR